MWPGIPDTYQNLPESDSGNFGIPDHVTYQTPTRHALLGSGSCWKTHLKLHQHFLLVNSYGFYMKNRNRFYSYQFHVYVTFLPYTWKRIREMFMYTWFSTLPTLTTYVTWRWKSRVRHITTTHEQHLHLCISVVSHLHQWSAEALNIAALRTKPRGISENRRRFCEWWSRVVLRCGGVVAEYWWGVLAATTWYIPPRRACWRSRGPSQCGPAAEHGSPSTNAPEHRPEDARCRTQPRYLQFQ